MKQEDIVLDASALLAFLQNEVGSESVGIYLTDYKAVISTVNYSEICAKFNELGIDLLAFDRDFRKLGIEIIPFDRNLALRAGGLRVTTKQHCLSFGDRACLALSIELNVPVVTADTAWGLLGDLAKVIQIR